MFTIEGVNQKNFNSIMRRSLVWRCKARFEDPHVIDAAYPDISKDGVFRKDPDLEAFLTSGPAVAAALQMQHAFEMEYSKEECVRMIEEFVTWGGDFGLTEATMRKACSLPPRDVTAATTRAAAVIDVEEPDEDKEEDAKWAALRAGVFEFLLGKKKLQATSSMFIHFRCPQGPNVSKAQILDALVARRFALKCPGVGRGSAAGGAMPVISWRVPLEKVIDHRNRECVITLQERCNVHNLENYLHGCAHRRGNVVILAEAWQKLSRQKLSKPGRPDPDALKKKNEMQDRAKKLLEAEASGDRLLERLSGPAPKRRRGKSSNVDVKVEDNHVVEMSCAYRYSGLATLRGRKQVADIGAQKFTRRVQQVLLPETRDLDIENSLFTIMPQLLQKMELDPGMPAETWEALEACWKDRSGLCSSKLQTSTIEGKQLLVSMFYGGGCPKHLQRLDFVHEFQKAAIYCKWLAASALPEEYVELVKDEAKKNPEASLLSYLYFACEDFILSHWADFLVKTVAPNHLSLHFDGVRISTVSELDVDQLCRDSEQYVERVTGFQIQIREKKHKNIVQLLKDKAAVVKDPRFDAAHVLRQPGNCIPHSIACLQTIESAKEDLLASADDPLNVHMRQRGCRTYAQCVDMLGCNLCPSLLPVGDLPDGAFLLHSENGGLPHCVAVYRSMEEGGPVGVTVWDNDCTLEMSDASFQSAVLEGIDSATCVFFNLVSAPVERQADAAETHLLELSAGACRMEAVKDLDESDEEQSQGLLADHSEVEHVGEDGKEIPCHDFQWLDDAGVVVVEDFLLESLCGEVRDAVAKASSAPSRGMARCLLCPFRAFDRKAQLLTHLQRYHNRKQQYCASGTKQLRLVLALHDADQLQRQCGKNYLQRSAMCLRSSIRPMLSTKQNAIDKKIRLLLDGSGPKVVHADYLKAGLLSARRVGRLWYTHAFAEQVWQEMLLQQGKAGHGQVQFCIGCTCLCVCVSHHGLRHRRCGPGFS